MIRCNLLVMRSSTMKKISIFFYIISEIMDQYVTYNNELHTLICRQHKFGLSPDWIERHFRESHKTIPLEIRQEIIRYSKSLDLWQPEWVNNLLLSLIAIPELRMILGWKCQHRVCQELRSIELSMKKHCRDVHGWKTVNGTMWIAQTMQTIFPSSHRR